jgi:catechol 2,3-dioxygenase-like lactoylglutathione lyase family enzyme
MMCNVRHVGIVSNNIDESISFYSRLGFSVAVDAMESGSHIDEFSFLLNANVRTVKLQSKSGGCMIELLDWGTDQVTSPNQGITNTGFSHAAFTVSDLQSLYEELSEHGTSFNCSPQLVPSGKFLVAFCMDPNGVFIELVEEL